MAAIKYYGLDVGSVTRVLSSSERRGLEEALAAKRLGEFGPNCLKAPPAHNPLRLFLEQFKDFIVWVLIGAAVVSGILGEWIDAAAIVGIVVLNAILGFIQEYRAERSLAALRKLSSPVTKVIRAGVKKTIPSSELVPGDLVELEAGDNIAADGRLVWTTPNFCVQEASLTGESTPAAKTASALLEKEVPLADRANMVYMGTSVAVGKARALITATGMQTELGKIAGMIQEIGEEATPLQKRLERFGKWIVYLCLTLVGVVFLLGVIRGGSMLEVFLTAVSLAVAAIPEGLPTVVTIALALGVQRMVRRNALIRRLPSVETLGCATVICSDKTGTLTKNEMTVRSVFAGGKLFDVTGTGYEPKGGFLTGGVEAGPARYPALEEALTCGVLSSVAELISEPSGYRIAGDPTEGAIVVAAAKAGLERRTLESVYAFTEEIPFDPERKKMTIVREKNGLQTAFVKGAPDILLADCSMIGTRKLEARDREEILRVNDELAGRAMRVLAIARRDLGTKVDTYDPGAIETALTFVGLIAMIDPPREEAKEAIRKCATAGIRVVMITGDHKKTAVAIAGELGFFPEGSGALTGEELDKLSDQELTEVVTRTPVYARVSPEHKLRVVRAWRARGEIVAMTGDGVNDAPAVKEADIGVAMGLTGTDVTKEVADMVVTDDNFASIVAAVEEGRGIYDNIKKFIHFLLSCNAGEIFVMFTASLVGMPPPLLPVQILWVNLVTDGLPALALGIDPTDPGIMERPPRPKDEAIVTKDKALLMLMQGAFIAACSLLAFFIVLYVEKEGIARARTAAFVVLSCAQLFHSFNCRSTERSIFAIGVLTNRKLIAANAVSFALLIAAVYLPFAQRIFRTENLTLVDWGMVLAISSFPLWAMEMVKFVRFRRGFAPKGEKGKRCAIIGPR